MPAREGAAGVLGASLPAPGGTSSEERGEGPDKAPGECGALLAEWRGELAALPADLAHGWGAAAARLPAVEGWLPRPCRTEEKVLGGSEGASRTQSKGRAAGSGTAAVEYQGETSDAAHRRGCCHEAGLQRRQARGRQASGAGGEGGQGTVRQVFLHGRQGGQLGGFAGSCGVNSACQYCIRCRTPPLLCRGSAG